MNILSKFLQVSNEELSSLSCSAGDVLRVFKDVNLKPRRNLFEYYNDQASCKQE